MPRPMRTQRNGDCVGSETFLPWGRVERPDMMSASPSRRGLCGVALCDGSCPEIGQDENNRATSRPYKQLARRQRRYCGPWLWVGGNPLGTWRNVKTRPLSGSQADVPGSYRLDAISLTRVASCGFKSHRAHSLSPVKSSVLQAVPLTAPRGDAKRPPILVGTS